VGASIGAARLNALLHRAQGAEADLTEQVAKLERAERATRENLFDNYVEKARALRRSQRRGQRFECLDTIRKAVQLGRELDLPAERFHELRNEAAAALALLDIRPVHEWVGMPKSRMPESHVAFDLDLKRYARCSHHGAVSLRRVADDTELFRLPGFDAGDIYHPDFSPDARHLSVYQERGGRIKVWRLDSSPAVLVHEVGTPGQSTPAFAPDGRALAYVCPYGAVAFVELATGHSRRLPAADGARGFPFAAPAVALHRDGRRFAVATRVGPQSVVQVRERDTGRVLNTLSGARHTFSHPIWHPSGRLLAVADRLTIRVWDAVTKTWTTEMEATTNGGLALTFSNAGDLLVSTDWNGETRFWEPQSGLLLFKADTRLAKVQFSRDDLHLTGSVGDPSTGLLCLWEMARPCARRVRLKHNGYPVCSDNGLLAVGIGDEGVEFWDLHSLQRVALLAGLGKEPYGLAFDERGTLWTFGDNGLFAWPIQSTAPGVARIGPAVSFPSGPRSDWYDTPSVDRRGSLVAVRARTGPRALRVGPPGRLLSLGATVRHGRPVVSPDGRWIALSNESGNAVRILDPDTRRLLQELPLPGCNGLLGVSPDGRWLWAQDGKGQVHLWQTATWTRTTPIAATYSPGFAPDSSILAFETGEGRIRLLDPDTQKEFVLLEDPSQDIAKAVTFSHDGTQLVTASFRATRALHVWDLRLLRAELAKMDLDWGQAPYAPARVAATTPARFVVDRGAMPLAPEAGLIAYSLALAMQPLNPAAYVERAAIFLQQNRFAEALADCDRALALAPSARAWFLRGQVQENLRFRGGALTNYSEAVRLAPDEESYRQARLPLAQALGQGRVVAEDSDWLIQRHAATPLILNNRAWALLTGTPEQWDPPRALLLARQAVEQDTENALFRNTLGVALYRNASYAEARVALEESLKRSQGASDAFDLFFLAMCHARLGDRKGALQSFQQAVHWVKERKSSLSATWTEELKSFEGEAAGVLK
jgi:WD40 repeat protein/Tfp pilus assembly protein PilF